MKPPCTNLHLSLIHIYATNVIALTYILPLTDRDFTRALWQSATECPVVFPEGCLLYTSRCV